VDVGAMEEDLASENAAVRLFDQGRFEDAKDMFFDVIQRSGETLQRVFYVARCESELGNVTDALDMFLSMRQSEEGKCYSYIDLHIALCHHKLGDLSTARQELTKLLDHKEFVGNVHLILAKMAESEAEKKQLLLDGFEKHGNHECACMLGNYYVEHDPENAIHLARPCFEHAMHFPSPEHCRREANFRLGTLLITKDPANIILGLGHINAAFSEDFPPALEAVENIQIYAASQVEEPSGTTYDSALELYHHRDKKIDEAIRKMKNLKSKKTPGVHFNWGLMMFADVPTHTLVGAMQHVQKAADSGHVKAIEFIATIRTYF
jgi:tetratricopeptide (TPR) repeat protein